MRRLAQLMSGSVIALASIVALPMLAFAHVVVTPAQAGVGASTLFNVSIPNEKEVGVTSIKLLIPAGVQNVMPDVAGGWTITTETSGDNVTSITWTGSIPVGQRADLSFKAQTPAKAGALDWKAYQTYADGTVVNWDQNPDTNGKAVKNDVGPYSVTKVVNDLGSSNTSRQSSSDNTATLALIAAIAALIFSLFSLFVRRRR